MSNIYTNQKVYSFFIAIIEDRGPTKCQIKQKQILLSYWAEILFQLSQKVL